LSLEPVQERASARVPGLVLAQVPGLVLAQVPGLVLAQVPGQVLAQVSALVLALVPGLVSAQVSAMAEERALVQGRDLNCHRHRLLLLEKGLALKACQPRHG